MKLKKSQKKLSLVLIFVILGLLGTIVYFKPEVLNGLLLNQSQSSKTFESKYLKFSVVLPPEFLAVDEATQIVIDSQGGRISVSRNGSNYSSLDNYILEFDSRRNLIASDLEKLKINEYEALSRLVEFPDQSVKQKSYYIYINNWIYILSTSSEDLYDELDQIAKSFKYTGK